MVTCTFAHRAPRAWLSGLILACMACGAATPAQAQTSTALKLAIGGLSLTADVLGVGGTLASIFGTSALDTQSDDHPLYSIAGSSPSLVISATDTSFDLLLKQTNNVGEFEDDLPAVLSGTTKVRDAHGNHDVWNWKITLEADINFFSRSELDAQGYVQHVYAPDPELHEVPEAPALNFDMTVRQRSYKAHILKAQDKDDAVHADGPHKDVLFPAELETRWIRNDEFDYINVHLHAVHVVPEPPTWMLFMLALIAAPFFIRKKHA